MTKKYRILFQGVLEDRESFRVRMSGFGMPSDAVDRLITGAPLVLKSGLSLGDARRWADDIQQAGGRVRIQEDGLLEDGRRFDRPLGIVGLSGFTLCPRCGLKQRRGETCERCGIRLG